MGNNQSKGKQQTPEKERGVFEDEVSLRKKANDHTRGNAYWWGNHYRKLGECSARIWDSIVRDIEAYRAVLGNIDGRTVKDALIESEYVYNNTKHVDLLDMRDSLLVKSISGTVTRYLTCFSWCDLILGVVLLLLVATQELVPALGYAMSFVVLLKGILLSVTNDAKKFKREAVTALNSQLAMTFETRFHANTDIGGNLRQGTRLIAYVDKDGILHVTKVKKLEMEKTELDRAPVVQNRVVSMSSPPNPESQSTKQSSPKAATKTATDSGAGTGESGSPKTNPTTQNN